MHYGRGSPRTRWGKSSAAELGVKCTCVIGGGGFIGQHLVRRLVASDRRVIVVGRRASSPFEAGIEYRSVEPDRPKPLVRRARGGRRGRGSFVFHVAPD